MLVGVAQAIRNHEYRAGLKPGSIREMVRHGQWVSVRRGAGTAIGPCAGDRSAADVILVPSAKAPQPPRREQLPKFHPGSALVDVSIDHGSRRAPLDDSHLRNGLNIFQRRGTCAPVAKFLGLAWTDSGKALSSGV